MIETLRTIGRTPLGTVERERRAATLCLLTHGFHGAPEEMCELEDALGALGFATRRPLLPGHCSTLRDFAAHGWDDWLAALHAETRLALAGYERVILIGHSMGAAVSLVVASREPRVAGVVALCPPVRLSAYQQQLVARFRRVVPYIPRLGEDMRDWRAWLRSHYLRRRDHILTPMKSVHSLFEGLPDVQEALPAVRCPALVVCARHDHVVPMRDGVEAYQRISSAQKSLLILNRSYHAVTRDVERELVFERVNTFCEGL